MSKLAHSNQATMDYIEARSREDNGETFDMDDEATIFAAHLLVPEDFLKVEISKLSPVVDIDDEEWLSNLARKFKVTRGLMQYRLKLHYAQR